MAKKYSVIVEERAYNDLRNIFIYIAKDSPLIADQIYDGLLEQMHSLEEFPQKHQVIIIVHDHEIRHLVFKKRFRILYTIRNNTVHILHCFRSEQNLENCL
jgi:plasmid stabilization system protein ParE